MPWTDTYQFEEPLEDLRSDPAHADALTAELEREVAPGHPLHGRAWRVIAHALPNDDVIVVCGDDVAAVHLTWIQKQDRPPYPETTFVASAEELESYVELECDWGPWAE